jgi:hypothetical protein
MTRTCGPCCAKAGRGRPSGGKICAVEHKDAQVEGEAGNHDGFLGRSKALLREAEPVRSPELPSFVLEGKLIERGSIMLEQLDIVDLGDAMAETRCSLTIGSQYDFQFGPGHWRC